MRGNRLSCVSYLLPPGSIPARAGEPISIRLLRADCRVYPRACGGTDAPHRARGPLAGLSPRVRGNHILDHNEWGLPRSIPARAGEPTNGYDSTIIFRVYPRACGGTCPSGGSSWVYPRACGGTASCRLVGLSPRVRGNHDPSWVTVYPMGSIPARAGEPGRSPCHPSEARVYPRACGGTSRASSFNGNSSGLSPRVRGNQDQNGSFVFVVRSIPARAGEPLEGVPRLGTLWVYPRACGGT